MELLIHTCCAPCLIKPLEELLAKKVQPVLYFDNPNIQPLAEYTKRLAAVERVAKNYNLELILPFSLADYPKKSAEYESLLKTKNFGQRCVSCYYQRLNRTAKLASQLNMAFTTTLLYSKYQKHSCIQKLSEALAKKYSTKFYYEDYRVFWQAGITRSKELELYRQKYCGCLLSSEYK